MSREKCVDQAAANGLELFVAVNKAELLTSEADRADADEAMTSMLTSCGLQGTLAGKLHYISARQAATEKAAGGRSGGEDAGGGEGGLESEWQRRMDEMIAAIRSSLETSVKRRVELLTELVGKLEQPLEATQRKVEFWRGLRVRPLQSTAEWHSGGTRWAAVGSVPASC